MQAFKRISGLVLATAVVTTLATGCETGREHKNHSDVDYIMDITTTNEPDAELAANPEGLPPVPGSPTAAGIDGRQPFNDGDARTSPGAEEGFAAAPNHHHPDAFQRQ